VGGGDGGKSASEGIYETVRRGTPTNSPGKKFSGKAKV